MQTSDAPAPEETPGAYPLVQPMRAALYFDSPVGFGEWRVFISTRADKDLREARKKDPTKFDIYVKKIKCVSCWGIAFRADCGGYKGTFEWPLFG